MTLRNAACLEPIDQDAVLANALSASLGGLLAMAEMMSRQSLSKAARDQLAAMTLAAKRMERLLDDARARPAGETTSRSLRDVVEAAEAAWSIRLDEGSPKVLVSTAFPPDLRVSVDAEGLTRLLDLLVAVAHDRAPRGFVNIDLQAGPSHEGRLELLGRLPVLSDIGPDETARIAAAEKAAASLGGELVVAAEAGGHRLSFRLPLAPASDVADMPVAAVEEAPLPEATRLLIVDDNATNRMVAAALCGMFGCVSETAEDGLEAVEAVRARPFDLILMDIKMPRMDGVAATREIRNLKGPASATPIVALTANADPQTVAMCLAAGMAGVVDKPIKPAQLLQAMQSALGVQQEGLLRAPAA